MANGLKIYRLVMGFRGGVELNVKQREYSCGIECEYKKVFIYLNIDLNF